MATLAMSRIYQEFYCASSGGGCGGYVTVRLNMAINGVVEIICPKCSHKHQRKIKNGVLTDGGRYSSCVTQEIIPVLAAWHRKARHPESKKRVGTLDERKAVVIDEHDPNSFLKDRRFELHGSGAPDSF